MTAAGETREGVYTVDVDEERAVDFVPGAELSADAGRTWREAGGGLPAGRAIAIADDDPDRMLYAAAHRLYVSTDGGRFWRSIEPELPEIIRVAWLD